MAVAGEQSLKSCLGWAPFGSAHRPNGQPLSKQGTFVAMREKEVSVSKSRSNARGFKKGATPDYSKVLSRGSNMGTATRCPKGSTLDTSHSLNTALRAMCTKSHHSLEECETWLAQQLLDDQSGQVTVQTFTIIIRACIKAGQIIRSEKWLREMLCRGLQPNTLTIQVMLSAGERLCDQTQIQRIAQILTDMGLEREGFYNTLIKACSRKKDIPKTESLLSNMLGDGHQISLDNLNSAIHAYTMGGDFDRIEHCLKFLHAHGMEPDLITYNSIINACAARGDATAAKLWFTRLREVGLQPNAVTYGTICKTLSRNGDIASIERVMKSVEEAGIALNEYFYASLISACSVAQPPEPLRAELAFAEMLSRNLRVQNVKKALKRVLSKNRVAELYLNLVDGSSAEVDSMETAAR